MPGGTVISWNGLERILGSKCPQRGMILRAHPSYSAVFCSFRKSSAYTDEELPDGTIIYCGHNAWRNASATPVSTDQPLLTRSGKLTANAHFLQAAREARQGLREPEPVRVFEKLSPGIWRDKGFYRLTDCRETDECGRRVYRFILIPECNIPLFESINPGAGRSIPARIRAAVWERDGGRCIECGSTGNLTFDHIIPVALGGSSSAINNIQILCARCNSMKSTSIGWGN
jgi:hypothetical protein